VCPNGLPTFLPLAFEVVKICVLQKKREINLSLKNKKNIAIVSMGRDSKQQV
jgi:hypothetical protein